MKRNFRDKIWDSKEKVRDSKMEVVKVPFYENSNNPTTIIGIHSLIIEKMKQLVVENMS